MPCARERTRIIVSNTLDYLPAGPCRMTTLTLAHSARPLTEQLDRLIACFRRLRRTPIWKRHVVGGLATIEVTRGTDGHWHPHVHVIMQGRYLPHSDLRAAWYQITGDSLIVDIRMARDDADALAYVTKYLSKSLTPNVVHDPDLLDEYVTAVHARKLLYAIGTWRALRATTLPSPGAWEYVCTLRELVRRAGSGEADAIAILTTIAGNRLPAVLASVPPAPARPPEPARSPVDLQLLLVLSTDFAVPVTSWWRDRG